MLGKHAALQQERRTRQQQHGAQQKKDRGEKDTGRSDQGWRDAELAQQNACGGLDEEPCQHYAGGGGGSCEQKSFEQRVLCELRGGGAQSAADGDLLPPCGAACEQEAGGAGTADEPERGDGGTHGKQSCMLCLP